MAQSQKLDYETPPPNQPLGFHLPVDWRRRLAVASIAAPIIFLLSFEAARRQQSDLLLHNSRWGIAATQVRVLQQEVDEHVRRTRAQPNALSDVPAINDKYATMVDPWGRPYLLLDVKGAPTVMCYGRDGAPGGAGLDADFSARTHVPPLPRAQFLQLAPMAPVLLICTGAALLTALITFCGGTTVRRGPLNLWMLVLGAVITGTFAVLVGGVMAAFEVPTGH